MKQELINQLPIEVIHCIIPYTYQPQHKSLLNDIENYVKSRQKVLEIYNNYWIVEFEEEEPEDKHWLMNDLFLYINKQASIFGYSDYFYDTLMRQIRVDTRDDVIEYVKRLETKGIHSQINIFWGLLMAKERCQFIWSFIGTNF
jgi:hypothetical protein